MLYEVITKREKNKKLIEMMDITLFDKQQEQTISVKVKLGQWLIDMLSKCSIHQTEKQTLALVKKDFEDHVITSYSIHYTKLYESARRVHRRRSGSPRAPRAPASRRTGHEVPVRSRR